MNQRIQELEEMNQKNDKKITMIKAKEFDKVDLLKRVAESEARIKHLQLDNENLVRERNSLDIANVELTKHRAGLQQHVQTIEQELEFFKSAPPSAAGACAAVSFSPASSSTTWRSGCSLSRAAITAPADPAPTTTTRFSGGRTRATIVSPCSCAPVGRRGARRRCSGRSSTSSAAPAPAR